MSGGKIAFCFPGQGSAEPGMGRDVAEAIPEAVAVYGVGSEVSGLDLRQLCGAARLVVSGGGAVVEESGHGAQLEGAGRPVRLRVSGAFHSPLVARAAERLRPAIERVRCLEPTAPFVSTVTGRIESAQRMAPL